MTRALGLLPILSTHSTYHVTFVMPRILLHGFAVPDHPFHRSIKVAYFAITQLHPANRSARIRGRPYRIRLSIEIDMPRIRVLGFADLLHLCDLSRESEC